MRALCVNFSDRTERKRPNAAASPSSVMGFIIRAAPGVVRAQVKSRSTAPTLSAMMRRKRWQTRGSDSTNVRLQRMARNIFDRISSGQQRKGGKNDAPLLATEGMVTALTAAGSTAGPLQPVLRVRRRRGGMLARLNSGRKGPRYVSIKGRYGPKAGMDQRPVWTKGRYEPEIKRK